MVRYNHELLYTLESSLLLQTFYELSRDDAWLQ